MVEFVLVILALLLAGMGVLALGAVRSGRSLRGELVFRAVLPLLKRSAQRQAATADGGEPILAPAPPPARIARRYDIRQTDGDGTISIMRRGQSAGRYVLYVHGGAYILPLMPQHWPILAALAEQVPATVVAPDYPLAPANDCQPAFAMMDALYDRLAAEVGPSNIVVVGDSAGGGLALALCQRWRDQGRALPAGVALLWPWLDVTASDPEQVELARRDPILSTDRLRAAGKAWAGTLPPDAPQVSPLFGSLEGLPPLLVLAGTEDILHSDARRLAAKAREVSAPLDFSEYRGMFHVWMAAPIPEAKRAMAQVAAFCRDRLNRPQ